MKTTQLDDDSEKKVLEIEAPWSEIEADYEELMARYAKVHIPGFRPGKAPRSAIERRFKKAIMDELKASLTQRLAREALRGADIEALGSPEASDIECETGQPFRARIRYLPMPEITLPDLADLRTNDDGTDARDRISRRLLELVTFEAPGELVRRELDVDGLGENVPGSEAWASASDRIRLMLILKRIARQEGIEVDETDVSKRIAEKSEEFGTTKESLEKELDEGGGMDRLKDMLLAESTLEYIEHQVSSGE
jgi:FKBP-type peptidyl-prolyl cis-trans isomerase (trigger factor)